MEAFRLFDLGLSSEFYISVSNIFLYFGLKAAGSNRGWTAGHISCFAGVRPSVLVLVAKKVLVVRTTGVEKAVEAGLSVSRSLSLSVSDENSFFPNVFLLQQEKATLFPIVETKKRLLSGLVRGPIVVTNCQNGPKSCPLSRDAPLPWLARPDKLLQMGGNSVSIELCDCFEKCPHQGRLMTRYISS